MGVPNEFLSEASGFVDWCKNKAIPLWSDIGVDARGVFHECLDPSGRPDLTINRRVRVQSRQIYVFAQAYHLGWYDFSPAICDRATEELLVGAVMRTPDGGFDGVVDALTSDGAVADETRDLYTHSFLLLALAWRRRAFGDETAIELADEIIAYLDQKMKAGNGGWIESLPEKTPRRQNPHMHLFEAFLALSEATGAERFLARAADMLTLFERVFFDPATGNLYEFFTQDWGPHPSEGHIVEPGHMMEWVWLLEKYGELSGKNLSDVSRQLYDRALAVGRDPVSGLLVDRISDDGSPIWSRRRLWPQTEFVKASLVMGRRGDIAAYGLAADVLAQLRSTYFNTGVEGAWRDRYDEKGGPLPGPIPASSLYHIMCCAAQVNEALERAAQPLAVSA